MISFKSLTKFFSAATAAVMTFGMFALAPMASAEIIIAFNVIDFDEDAAEVFDRSESGSIDFVVAKSVHTLDVEVALTIEGPLDSGNQIEEVIDSEIYDKDESKIFVWDGKIDGENADSGRYLATFDGENVHEPIEHEFILTNAQPSLSFVVTPATTYAPFEGDDYEAQVKVEGNIDFMTVEFGVMDLSDNNAPFELVGEHSFDADEGFTFTWDGTIDDQAVNPGDYKIGFQALGFDQYVKDILEHEVEIVAEPDAPTLSFDPNPASTYTLGKDYEAKVKLSNYDADVDVEMELTGPDDGDEVTFVADTHAYDQNETNTLMWDGQLNGKDVEAGDYTVTISSDDVDNKLSYKLTVKDAPVVEDETCEGFTDLDADYKYCDEVAVVKKAGLMTGNDDGTFDTGGLNRAEQVTVLLRLLGDDYDEVDAKADCVTPFPDVACSAWYGPKVYFSQKEGYVTGYKSPDPRAGTFGPDNDVLQSEALVLFHRILDINTNDSSKSFGSKVVANDWFSVAYNWTEDEALLPSAEINVRGLFTREQTARVLAKLIEEDVIDVDEL